MRFYFRTHDAQNYFNYSEPAMYKLFQECRPLLGSGFYARTGKIERETLHVRIGGSEI